MNKDLKHILWAIGIMLAFMYIPQHLCARGFFENWIAPGQTDKGRTAQFKFIGWDPFHPTTITLSNSERTDLYIQNVSTFPNVRIYISTSSSLPMWSTNTLHQTPFDLVSPSTNPYPAVSHGGVFVLGEYSTIPYVNRSFFVGGSTFITPMVNENYNSNIFPGVKGNTYHEKNAGWITYTGPWYAVAVGSYGVVNATQTATGKIRFVEEQP